MIATPGWLKCASSAVWRARLGPAVAVRDRGHARRRRGRVDRLVEVGVGRAVRLDQQDVAVRAGRRDHVEVEADLQSPAVVDGRQGRRGAVLVDLLEAAVGGGARRQPVVLAVDGEVLLGVRVVVGVDDGDRLAAGRRAGELVRRLDVGRPVAARRRRGHRAEHAVGAAHRDQLAEARRDRRAARVPAGERRDDGVHGRASRSATAPADAACGAASAVVIAAAPAEQGEAATRSGTG